MAMYCSETSDALLYMIYQTLVFVFRCKLSALTHTFHFPDKKAGAYPLSQSPEHNQFWSNEPTEHHEETVTPNLPLSSIWMRNVRMN
jgi:hypothetical protein